MLSIATNQFASFCIDNRSRQSAIFVFVKVAKFEIKRLFAVYFNSLLYKTNRFHVAVRLFSNRSQRTSKCGKNLSDTLGCASRTTFLFLPHFDVICDLLLNRRTATWNLFVKSIYLAEKYLPITKMAINFWVVNCLLEFLFWQFSLAGIFFGNCYPPSPPTVISNGPPITVSVHCTLDLQSEVQSLR